MTLLRSTLPESAAAAWPGHWQAVRGIQPQPANGNHDSQQRHFEFQPAGLAGRVPLIGSSSCFQVAAANQLPLPLCGACNRITIGTWINGQPAAAARLS